MPAVASFGVIRMTYKQPTVGSQQWAVFVEQVHFVMETVLATKLAMAHLVCRAGFRKESDRSFTADLHLRTGC